VDVVAAQMGIAIGGQHLEDAVVQSKDGDVEGSATQIVDRDDAFVPLIESVGQAGGGRLVHQTQHFQSGKTACVAGGLALGVVEVGRHGDDGLFDLLPQRLFRQVLQLQEDLRGNLRWSKHLAAELQA